MLKLLPTISMILLLASACVADSPADLTIRLYGTVTDSEGNSLLGATVVALQDGHLLDGTPTNSDGSFDLKCTPSTADTILLRVSSVGYQSETTKILPQDAADSMAIVLAGKLELVGSIIVYPADDRPYRDQTIRKGTVQVEAEASLVPTNPIAALKQPEVSRAGSSHSSQIRVHGTSPVYYLNGVPIGTDPAHYGLFAIIPSSVIDRISFHPMGAPASHRLASVVEFNTAQPFGRKSRGELILSTIEATGSFAVASERLYAVGSLRKSVLDRLVHYFDISSDRVTLPPTNFQDIFASVGIKLSRDFTLMADHYQVKDYLSYNSGAITQSGAGINTFQAFGEKMLSLRLVGYTSGALIEATAALRTGRRQYMAQPADAQAVEGLRVNIEERYNVGYTRLQSTLTLGSGKLIVGFEAEFDHPREQSLSQHNWNFLPPFHGTDNPFIYQQALNETYNAYRSEQKISSRAAFASLRTRVGRWNIESGIRYDQLSPLQDGRCLTGRASVMTSLGPNTQLRAAYGSFVSTPLDNILEPYQILIRDNLDKLTPEKTSLISLDLTHQLLRLNLFHKRLDRLPVLTPDFVSLHASDGELSPDFLSVRSEGAARFSGGSITGEKANLGGGPFSFLASYAYTRAYQIYHDLVLPYELHAPHRIRLRANYERSNRLVIGAELTARSGYPYSPLRNLTDPGDAGIYTNSYYNSSRAAENSLRFAAHTSLNMSLRYLIGRVQLLLSLSNVTNQANPIINAASGQIYDAGIMPMLGLKYQF